MTTVLDPYAGLSEKARELAVVRMRKTLSREPDHRTHHKATRQYLKTLVGKPALPPLEPPKPVQTETEREVHRACRMYDRKARVSPQGQAKQEEGLKSVLRRIQAGTCPVCMHPILGLGTFDHVVPLSRGGKDAGNLILMHGVCNQEKADRMPTGCELIWLAMVNAHLGARST